MFGRSHAMTAGPFPWNGRTFPFFQSRLMMSNMLLHSATK